MMELIMPGIVAAGASLTLWGIYRSWVGFQIVIVCSDHTVGIPNPKRKSLEAKHVGDSVSSIPSSSPSSSPTAPPPTIPLLHYLEDNCPSLFRERFYPTFWLPEGNLQTVWCTMTFLERVFNVKYSRDLLELPDKGTLAIDWAIPDNGEYNENSPTIVILHGLTGGSQESYIQDLITFIKDNYPSYRCVVVNFRGCAGSDLTSPMLYCAAFTGDLELAVQYIKSKAPNAPLIGVGFSLGSNVLVKYLGEKKHESPFIAAVSVSNPFDLLCGMNLLHQSFLGKYVYSRKLAKNLKRFFLKVAHVFDQSNVDVNQVLAAKSIREFDDSITRRVFGYPTVNHYYRDGGSWQYIHELQVPLLCLQALDDPVSLKEVIPYDECRINPNVILATTACGGHIGWFSGLIPKRRWCSKPIAEFANSMFEAFK